MKKKKKMMKTKKRMADEHRTSKPKEWKYTLHSHRTQAFVTLSNITWTISNATIMASSSNICFVVLFRSFNPLLIVFGIFLIIPFFVFSTQRKNFGHFLVTTSLSFLFCFDPSMLFFFFWCVRGYFPIFLSFKRAKY